MPDSRPMSQSNARPWVYRCRFTNWLMAQPWRGWRYRTMYRTFRVEQRNPFTGRLYAPAHGPWQAAWQALSFPHVHHWSEDAEPPVGAESEHTPRGPSGAR